MTEVPKIVHDRLRAASVPAHPDADLLTAFAEQALSAAERESVLGHLALCGDCREVVALALPAADAVAAPLATEAEVVRATVPRAQAPAPRKLSFAWPSLRWAALAAGIAVAASVLWLHPGRQNVATAPSPAPQVTASAPPAPAAQIAKPSTDQPTILARNDTAKLKSELPSSNKKVGAAAATAAGAASGVLLAEAKAERGQKKGEGNGSGAGMADKRPAVGGRVLDAPISNRTTQAFEVSGANASAAPTPSAEDTLMARNETSAIEAKVMKAKPAPLGIEAGINAKELQKTQAAASPAPARPQTRELAYSAKMASPAAQTPGHNANLTWAIVAGGLQRSMDNGQTWQTALHPDHSLLCYAIHDQDVWTGGQAGTIFLSSDGGATWIQLQPSVKGQVLSSDVTHIEVRGVAEITLSTSSNEVWTSADNGKVWDKK